MKPLPSASRGRLLLTLGSVLLLSLTLTSCSLPASNPAPSANSQQLYNAAVTAMYHGNYNTAVAEAAAATKANSRFVSAYLIEGSALRSLGSYGPAIDALTTAISLDPARYDLYLERMLSEQALGQTGAAINDVRQAWALAPAQPGTYWGLVTAFNNLGDYGDAIKVATLAIKMVPNDWPGYQRRAQLYVSFGNFALAGQDYTSALQLATSAADRSTILVSYAQALDTEGAEGRAAVIAKRAVAAQGTAAAYQELGDVLKHEGLLREAILAYLDAAQHASDSTEGAKRLMDAASLEQQLGATATARTLYRQALARASDPNVQAAIRTALQALP